VTDVLNLPEVLTYQPVQQTYVLSPGQVFLRGGTVAQPFVGLTRDRPFSGQVWPRGEYQSDKRVGSNIPAPPSFVATVDVTPATVSFAAGETAQLSVVVMDQNSIVLVGRTVVWSTSNAAKATVSSTGLVTAVAAGSATITATCEGKTDTCAVTVNASPAAVSTVTVTPNPWKVIPAGTVQLTAVPRDAGGTILTGRVISWSSDTPGVVTVSGTGLVTFVSAGTAIITATCETVPGTAAGTALPAPDVTDPLLYFSCDEAGPTAAILSTGRSAITLDYADTGSITPVITGERRKGRKVEHNVVFGGSGFRDGDYRLHGSLGSPIVDLAGDAAWSVAAWSNRALGYWGLDSLGYASLINHTDGAEYPWLLPLQWRRRSDAKIELTLEAYGILGLIRQTQLGVFETQLAAGWNHIAIVNKPSSAQLLVYLNAVLMGTFAVVDLSAYGRIKWSSLGCIAGPATASRAWGSFDEVYVFDRALTGTEVTTLASI
jgi:uncharacterized membrane protein